MDKTKQIKDNIQILIITFNCLQALIRETNQRNYADAVTISVVSKLVYERLEREKRNLAQPNGTISQFMKALEAPAEFVTPSLPSSSVIEAHAISSKLYQELWAKRWMDTSR